MRMKTQMHIPILPSSGVEVIVEGSLTRIFFDFTDPTPIDGHELPEDLKDCENVDVVGRSYGDIVSGIINDRYSADENQALMANYELAKDATSAISDEKRAEYLAEYSAYQDWRAHAKEIAQLVVSQIENK